MTAAGIFYKNFQNKIQNLKEADNSKVTKFFMFVSKFHMLYYTFAMMIKYSSNACSLVTDQSFQSKHMPLFAKKKCFCDSLSG